MLKVNEIFHSIQGESTYAGRPCVFVRLTGCNLRCSYCDTEYAFYEGVTMSIEEILTQMRAWKTKLVEVTGGEPMMQPSVVGLMERLLEDGYEVMLETGGSLSLEAVPEPVIKIVDFKTPSSGMEKKNLWNILEQLASHDQIKFVVGDRMDFDWVMDRLGDYHLHERWTVLLSPTYDVLTPDILAQWILEENLPVRMQIQMHKVIWDPNLRGV
jgi:7-carboxy-7-deazaguanine synthase